MSEKRSYEELARDIERLDSIIDAWEKEPRATVTARCATVESLNREALRRLIAHFKQDPKGLELLKSALGDAWILNVLVYHGLVRPPARPPEALEDRVKAALDKVRPQLESHGGDVELVAVVPPDEVRIRLLGSCDGCSSSSTTLELGVKDAIREACPEIAKITLAPAAPRPNGGLVTLRRGADQKSPFADGWEDAGPESALREGAMTAVDLPKASVLLTSVGGQVKAYANACPHLGMPLDQGEIEGEVITCRYHGFRFHLAEGNCLSAPEVALVPYPAKRHEGRILVQVGHG